MGDMIMHHGYMGFYWIMIKLMGGNVGMKEDEGKKGKMRYKRASFLLEGKRCV